MRILLICFTIISVTCSAFASPISSWDQRMFWSSFQSSCNTNMQRTSTMTSSQRSKWCECVATETVKTLTKEDLQPNQSASMNQKTTAASNICQKVLLSPSGIFK
jgi:hypothetical protein